MPISSASAPSSATASGMLSKPPAAAMLPLLMVFLCGITVGALAMSFFHNTHHVSTPADSWNKATVLKWKKELNLSAEQQSELETTLDDFSRYYDNVLADGKTRIMAILNEEQRQKFDRMLLERRKP